LLLLIIPQGTPATPPDAVVGANDCAYRLGLTSAAELATSDWISVAELVVYADDAVKHVAEAHGVFVKYDTSVTVSSGTAVYTLPSGHVFTLQAALLGGGSAVTSLRPASVADLFALDATWSATSGPAVRYSLDAPAVGSLTLYPNPSAGGTLALVAEMTPADLTTSAATVALPGVFSDWLSYAELNGALEKESEHAQRDMAAHYAERLKLFEHIMAGLYSEGLT
jgi:hypothetical protein